MFSHSKTQFKYHVKQTRRVLSHPNAASCHIDKWSAVLGIQFSPGPCPVTAD